jgi:hypothetical protein
MFDWLLGKRTFWDWFRKNAARVKSSDDVSAMASEISPHFDRQYPGLFWEIGRKEDGPWDFSVSANGDRTKFGDVERAVREAPPIDGWEIRAFRQRGSLSAKLQFGECVLGVDDIWCSSKSVDGGIALTLWIAGMNTRNERTIVGAAVLLLDHAIGEYDAVMKIRSLARKTLPADPADRGLFPLRELPKLLDEIPATQ